MESLSMVLTLMRDLALLRARVKSSLFCSFASRDPFVLMHRINGQRCANINRKSNPGPWKFDVSQRLRDSRFRNRLTELGNDLIIDIFRFNTFKETRSPISSGGVENFFVTSRSRTVRFCNFPTKGGSDVIYEKFRVNMFKLARSPISSGSSLKFHV